LQIAGGSVSLPCSAVGSPPPQLSWIFNGRTLYTDTKFQILSGRQYALHGHQFQILSGRHKDLYMDTKFQLLADRQDILYGYQVPDIVR
jgi:hypothetical protein